MSSKLCRKLLQASQDGAVEPLGARPGSTWCARTDIWNEAVCPFQVLAHQVEPGRAPSGSTAPSCEAGRSFRQMIQCLKVKDVGIN